MPGRTVSPQRAGLPNAGIGSASSSAMAISAIPIKEPRFNPNDWDEKELRNIATENNVPVMSKLNKNELFNQLNSLHLLEAREPKTRKTLTKK